MGTLRMVAVIQGRRVFATVLGFFEAVVVVAVLLCLVGLLAFFTILLGAELPWPAKL